MKTINQTEAYPLSWPEGYERTKYPKHSRFKAKSIYDTWSLLKNEVRLLGGKDLITSTNLRLKNSGDPYSSQKEPSDAGVAVYFLRKGQQVCIACDTYKHVWANSYAIAQTIRSMRDMARWGVSGILDRVFTGFIRIEEDAGKSWRSILGINVQEPTLEEIKKAYHSKMLKVHPDINKSDTGEAVVLNEAYQKALSELRSLEGVYS